MRPFTDLDIALLRCPGCLGVLRRDGDSALRCGGCATGFAIEAPGWPSLYREDEVRGPDRLMRRVYDSFARLHDIGVRYLLPTLEFGFEDLRRGTLFTEERLRQGYLRRLGLDAASLRPARGRQALRILDVGVGTGANLPLILHAIAALPSPPPVEYWGLDLSRGMLRRCAARLARMGQKGVRLLLADAHRLPFPSGSFDRVFHVGGIAGYRDPKVALAEMARVAVPGTPIVVVDEALDPTRRHSLYQRAGFRLITFYDAAPRCPRPLLPAGSQRVREEWVSRFYYCLSFEAPDAATAESVSTRTSPPPHN